MNDQISQKFGIQVESSSFRVIRDENRQSD